MNTKFEIGQKVSFLVSARHEAKIDCIQIGKNGKITYSVGGVMRDESVLEPVMEKKEQVTITNTIFDWDKFRNERVVVQCKTLKDAKEFLKCCHEQGMKWSSGDSLLNETKWDYGEDTCYEYDMGGLMFSPIGYYEGEGYTIVDCPVTHFSWEDFKGGKVIVHCDTEEKANAFLKECDAQGMTWRSGDSLLVRNNWKNYKETTCYENVLGGLGYSNIGGCFVESHKEISIYEYPAEEGAEYYRCTSGLNDIFTVGKIYSFLNGETTCNNGYTYGGWTKSNKELIDFLGRGESGILFERVYPIDKVEE